MLTDGLISQSSDQILSFYAISVLFSLYVTSGSGIIRVTREIGSFTRLTVSRLSIILADVGSSSGVSYGFVLTAPTTLFLTHPSSQREALRPPHLQSKRLSNGTD